MNKKSLEKRKFKELDIDDIIKKVNKKIKTELKNNRLFSVLSENEKTVLKDQWITNIVTLIDDSCARIQYLVNEIKVVKNAALELKKMSFLQVWAIYVTLVLKKNVFITGDAGTGKTRVLRFIMAHYYLIHKVKIEVTASTGKAAYELKSTGKTGKTIHSTFKLGKKLKEKNLKWKLRDKMYREWLKSVKALIIDECSMVNNTLLDSIVFLLKSNRNNTIKDIHFIVTGDFYQLPPVEGEFCFLNKDWYTDKTKSLLNESWKLLDFIYIGLTEIFRQEDPEFKCHCTNLRYGFFNETTYQYFKSCDYFEEDAVRLFSQKRLRDHYNNDRLDQLPGNDIIIRAQDTSDYIKEIRKIDPELRTLKEMENNQNHKIIDLVEKHRNLENVFINHTQSEYILRLRLNCRVMVIQNYSEGVVNGSSGTFIGWVHSTKSKEHKVNSKIGSDKECKYRDLDLNNGEKYFDHEMIIRLDDTDEEVHVGVCEMTEEDENEKKYIRKQFPVILFYAMTVHKSQSVTLKRAVIDLRGCTQKLTYTAISRVSSRDTLGIKNLTKASISQLTRVSKEEEAVREFYSHYVGIDVPKSPLIFHKD